MNNNNNNNSHQQAQAGLNNNNSETGSSKRQFFTSKAINLSSKLLTKSANYLSSKDLDSFANPINKVNNGINTKPTHQPTNQQQQQHHHRNLKHAKQYSTSTDAWHKWDRDTCNWNMIVGGQPVNGNNQSKRNSLQSSSSQQPQQKQQQPPQKPLTQTPPITPSNPGYLSYFHPQNWQRKNKESAYTEDHLVCFPGFVALGSPSHSRAGDIELFISIHAFRARPTLDNMTRSQRLVHSMICKMTGLPPLPSTNGTPLVDSNPENTTTLIEEELIGWDEEQNEKMRKFEPILPSTNQSPNRQSRLSTSFDRQIRLSEQIQQLQPLDTQSTSQAAQIICTAPTPIKTNMPNPLLISSLSRSSSTSSTSSYRRLFHPDVNLKHPNDLLDNGVGRMMEKFNIEKEDLLTLHFNLKERLHSFFSQKSESTKVRLKLFGICSSMTTTGSISKNLFRSRIESPTLLTPELEQDEFIINNGRPLLTQVITTKPGGVWSDKLVLPWQTIETHLRVYQMQQKANSANLSQSSSSQSPETGITRLRIEAELIKDEASDSCPKAPELAPDPASNKDQQLRKLSVGKSSLVMELDVIPALAETVHVISDIDDTIKHTNVLGGLKSVFKNVFLAGLDQVAIEGMAKWYQDLQELGCWMHYISNSPLELWYCIEGFLAANGFPRGSISLKEYARGATSILSGMLESAGSRKRASPLPIPSDNLSNPLTQRVESIIKQFPNSKFICVGDSGEQDLEMYVSLAQAYPGRIISIYIRDVTTPAILGKDISIDQLSASDQASSDWEDQIRPRNQTRANVFAASRSSSPSRYSFTMAESNSQRSKSFDLLSHTVPVPVNKRFSHRPVAPPKPQHLSSKPGSAPKPVVDANKRLSKVQLSANSSTDHLFDSSTNSPRSASFNTTASSLDNQYRFEKDGASPSMSSTFNTNRTSYQPSTITTTNTNTLAEDIKVQSLLDGFRTRVHKAESELNQLQLINPTSQQNHHQTDPLYHQPQSLSHEPSRDQLAQQQKMQVCFTNTKLKLFRTGFDDCVAESVADVKKLLNLNN
ncbi:hypothetical protein PGTUg99_019203 [Puccinia graminis f. sp. tritici]|uniref:Phosphatidate phosphatase APP1 catalytic domain-containing protein n=1 Tax=Puccinia graminis f. sp. tritici TaxID=56615 RepID=A0A5B0SH74_PUCGR|nr:hypothetical protein PGTUg99_019203 [Puccinia graminis f. sp. tritici]